MPWWSYAEREWKFQRDSLATIVGLSPKHPHCGLRVVEISPYIAARIFIEGFSSILRIMNLLNLTVGTYAKAYADNTDEARITWQDRSSLSQIKDAGTAHKQQQLTENQLFEDKEGLLYGPDIAD